MKHSRFRRHLPLWGTVSCILGMLYLLRWPLLGGLIERQIRREIRGALNAGMTFTRPEGSIVSSLTLSSVVLEPRPGCPFLAARAERLEAAYPWFGLGGLRLHVRGLRLELAPGQSPSTPVQEQIREGLAALESLRLR